MDAPRPSPDSPYWLVFHASNRITSSPSSRTVVSSRLGLVALRCRDVTLIGKIAEVDPISWISPNGVVDKRDWTGLRG
jgi:hypothetical protein